MIMANINILSLEDRVDEKNVRTYNKGKA